mmetsp:Transcript_8615/g.16313  ORF Transcript_8615/g.16313 Transcript_8615/m.16313 type:complete len:282 (+) Transcript_8615:964-1809(+)
MNHLCCAQHAQCGCSYIPSQHEAGVIHFSGIGSDIDQSANVVCLPLIQVKSHWDAEVANLWDGEYTPSPLNDILGRAALVIGTDFGGYNLVSNNCEHFASWLRYGVKLCKQVDTAVFNSGLAVAGMVVAGPVGAILAAGFFGNFQENQTQDAEPSSGVGLGDWHDIPIESGTAARHPEACFLISSNARISAWCYAMWLTLSQLDQHCFMIWFFPRHSKVWRCDGSLSAQRFSARACIFAQKQHPANSHIPTDVHTGTVPFRQKEQLELKYCLISICRSSFR